MVMTKAKMIEKMQMAEAQAWKDYRSAKDVSGEDDPRTLRYKAEWLALYGLICDLGLESLSISALIENDLLPLYGE